MILSVSGKFLDIPSVALTVLPHGTGWIPQRRSHILLSVFSGRWRSGFPDLKHKHVILCVWKIRRTVQWRMPSGQRYLQPHITSVSVQLFLQLLFGQFVHVQHRMFPLDLLHAVGVVWHVMADLHLTQRVPVALISHLEVLHEVGECLVLQRFVHQVLAPADPEGAEASAAVDPQHDVTEMTPWEACLKAEGKPLHALQTVGEVTDRSTLLRSTLMHWQTWWAEALNLV